VFCAHTPRDRLTKVLVLRASVKMVLIQNHPSPKPFPTECITLSHRSETRGALCTKGLLFPYVGTRPQVAIFERVPRA